MARNSKRKRQTQLGFSPVASSSPAAKGYPKQIQERAAMVTFTGGGSPAKKRRISRSEPEDSTNSLAPLPTPAGTVELNGSGGGSAIGNGQTVAEAHEVTSDSDSEPIRSTQKRTGTFSSKRRKGKQRELKFSGVEDGAPGSSLNISSPTAPRSSQRIFGKGKRKAVEIESDESEELPSPKKLVANGAEEGGSKNRKRGLVRTTRSQQQQQPVEVESDEEEIEVQSKSNAMEVDDDDDSEDAMPTTSGKQRRQRGRAAKEGSFVVSSSPPRAVDSDDEVQVIEQPRKGPEEDASEDEDEEDEAPKTPGRRKLQRPKRVLTQQEQEDINEDLDFLAPSDEDSGSEKRAPRNTQSAAKTARLSALEQLKRKRSKQPVGPVIIEDDEGGEDGVLGYEDNGEGDDDEEGIIEVNDDEDDEQEADTEADTQVDIPPQPTNSRDFFRSTADDDAFLASDEETNDLGVPAGIPLAFTRYASMKTKELFKFAVEFMVQKKLNPAFQMGDEIYELTFRKLDDEVHGLANSKFSSAAWTPEFTKQLRARPEIAIEEIDRYNPEHFLRDHCDACNRSGHPATFEVQFQGKPYNKQTLEAVGGTGNDSDDDDDDSDDESNAGSKPDPGDRPDYDAQGIEIAPANTIYYVGKFCKANAETAHGLQHWRFALNDYVVSWLVAQGYSRPAKIVERDRWSTKKRRKYANKIVDRMEEEGVVKDLWREFRNTVSAARDSKQGRY